MALNDTDIFSRTIALLGDNALWRLSAAKIILFGTGGVGSWCAEALVRSGITHLTLVDFDDVAPSNINRQLPATADTIGQKKVAVLQQRLLSINPNADINIITEPFNSDNKDMFRLYEYDYIIDAIDSVADKADLILTALNTPTSPTLFSSMGAASKIDSSKIRISTFDKVAGCPLARALRHRFKTIGKMPPRKFLCVWSDEYIPETPKGTLMYITAAFGLRLAEMVIRDICNAFA